MFQLDVKVSEPEYQGQYPKYKEQDRKIFPGLAFGKFYRGRHCELLDN
jgi:hypothetical protein